MSTLNRRDFLIFLGATSATALSSCQLLTSKTGPSKFSNLGWSPLQPSSADKVLLADGLNYSILAKWQDPIGKDLFFGAHSDFTQMISFSENTAANTNEGLLWVNHEYVNPLFASGWDRFSKEPRIKSQVDLEMKQIGGSMLHLKKENDQWTLIKDSKHNTRFDAFSEFDIISEEPIGKSNKAYGTVANCAGGITPWKTFLTCEENFDMFFGNQEWIMGKYKETRHPLDYRWTQFYPRSAFHYGWVVEIDPKTKKGQKLTALGRFSHEGATCVLAKDGRTVVYMGDDANNECIYKFMGDFGSF